MTFASFVIQLLNGLAAASSLFLVSAGLSLIFGVTRIVNFAHGSLYMLGLYGAYSLIEALGRTPLGFWSAVIVAALAVGLVGVLIEVSILRRIYRAPELFQLLATFAVVLVIKDAALAAWGSEDLVGPRAPGLTLAVEILGKRIPIYDLLLIAIGPVVLGLMWLLLVVVVIAGLWMVGAYNGLISLKNQTVNAFKQIDVQLKRRHDLIPNLVNAVKGAMNFERATLEAVVQARNQAVKVNASGPEAMKQISQAENALSGALTRLLAVVERYPDLKATGNIGQLQEELTSTENRIAFARQLYNDTATQYNTKQQQFPTTLVAGIANAAPAELWEIEEQAERAVPQVDLSGR